MEKTGFHEDFINGAGKTVTAEIFFYMESEPSDKQILYLPEGSEEILIFHRNILADEPCHTTLPEESVAGTSIRR